MTTWLPFDYLFDYLKIGSNTVYLNKVVKVVIILYTHVEKGDHDPPWGGIWGKNDYLNTPRSPEPKNGAKKGSHEKWLPRNFENFCMPTQENGAKKGSHRPINIIFSNMHRSVTGVKYYYE